MSQYVLCYIHGAINIAEDHYRIQFGAHTILKINIAARRHEKMYKI